MTDTKKKKVTHKITYSVDAAKGELKVLMTPSMKRSKLEDHQILVNAVIAGNDIALQRLLGTLPLLRPATDAERELKIYVYKDDMVDNDLFNKRKALYDMVAKSFEGTLEALFPDVRYIEQSRQHQQEIIFDMTSEEAEEHKLLVEEVVAKVREEDVEV